MYGNAGGLAWHLRVAKDIGNVVMGRFFNHGMPNVVVRCGAELSGPCKRQSVLRSIQLETCACVCIQSI